MPFLLFILGTMEYGRLMWTREALQQTAIAGARCMGMTQTGSGTSGVYSASMTTAFVVAQASSWSIPLTSANISLNNTATCGGVSGFSQVSLAYTFNTVVPMMPATSGWRRAGLRDGVLPEPSVVAAALLQA